jgi:hypothetical protein
MYCMYKETIYNTQYFFNSARYKNALNKMFLEFCK